MASVVHRTACALKSAFTGGPALFALTLAAGQLGADARPLDEVVKAKVLRVVVYSDNRPFSYMDGEQATGIDVEIGKAIAKHIGVETEIVPRMTGEDVDADLRYNIWKGPIAEGKAGIGDVMLHVPVDKELGIRNNQAVIGNSYFEERIVLAVDPDKLGSVTDFEVFRKEKIGVRYATVADYFLLRYADGAIIDNVVHHTKLSVGIAQFAGKETAALLGVQSEIENELHARGLTVKFVELPMPGLVRKSWLIGTAVAENSHDLGYAVGEALEALRTSGEMERIFASYGVTYVAPSAP